MNEADSLEKFLDNITDAMNNCKGCMFCYSACPWCHIELEDAIKDTGNEGKIEVKDIAELVAEAL